MKRHLPEGEEDGRCVSMVAKRQTFRNHKNFLRRVNMLNDDLHNDPNLPVAWAPWFSHEYLSYSAVQMIDGLMALPPVSVSPNPHYGEKLWPTGPKHIDLYKESYQEQKRYDLLWAFDLKKRNGDYAHDVPSGKKIEPWKIVVIYSTEPDLYLDDDLYLSKNQKITGGSRGWRHMYFKMLGTYYGMAPKSYRTLKDLAKLAFDNGNDYWGWRYLSRCGHYLADLGSPFHVKALSGFRMIGNFLARRNLYEVVSIIHQSFEVYVERRFREGFKPFRDAVAQGAREGQHLQGDIDTHIQDYIERAGKKHDAIFDFFYKKFDPALLAIFDQKEQESPADAASQINRRLPEATKILFSEENLQKLESLDVITGNLLFDVGRMLGALFNEFSVYASANQNK
jgi:hypothetical protein